MARHLLRLVEERARAAGARRVLRAHLTLGVGSHVAPDALARCFELLAEQGAGPAAGARLSVVRLPMRFHCRGCGLPYAVGGSDCRCPSCGRLGRLTDPGDALRLETLEVV